MPEDILPTFVSPSVVRADIGKTRAYVKDLSNEVVEAYASSQGKRTADQEKFFSDYAQWRNKFEKWADDNSNETWTPFQVLATSAIAKQNDTYRDEAAKWQEKFKAQGFSSTAEKPAPAPGATTPGGELLAGMGLGGALALLVVLYLASEENKGGRRR